MTDRLVFTQNLKLNNPSLRKWITQSEFHLKPTGRFAHYDDGATHPWNQEGLCVTISARKAVICDWKKISETEELNSIFTDALDPDCGYDVTRLKFLITAEDGPIEMSNQLLETINQISTRDSSFTSRETDEKLELLNNTIENMLKKDGKFISINSDRLMGLLTDNQIKIFRQSTQCFRHASDKALSDRLKLDSQQKDFLVNFGVLIVVTLSNI